MPTKCIICNRHMVLEEGRLVCYHGQTNDSKTAVSLPRLEIVVNHDWEEDYYIRAKGLHAMTRAQALEVLHRIETWPQVVEALRVQSFVFDFLVKRIGNNMNADELKSVAEAFNQGQAALAAAERKG